MKKLLYIIGLALVFGACEKVIEIDYKDGDPKLVIDAEIFQNGENRVLLTMSQALDNDNPITSVSGALVTIKDPSNVVHTLTESVPGNYTMPVVAQLPGVYELTVVHGGETNTATSTMPGAIVLDSITSEASLGFGGEIQNVVSMFYFDPVAETNFYRLKAWQNFARMDDVYFWDDSFFNGEEVNFPLYGYAFDSADVVEIELISMDEPSYEYFKVLGESQQSGGPFGSTPGNPISNINGSAIGVFGAYASDRKTIVIP